MCLYTTLGTVLDTLLVAVVLVSLFVCFVISCHCKITAYVGDNKLILILLSERDGVTFGSSLSQIRLSVVSNVVAPYSRR